MLYVKEYHCDAAKLHEPSSPPHENIYRFSLTCITRKVPMINKSYVNRPYMPGR